MERKKAIRKRLLKKRDEIGEEVRREGSRLILETLLLQPWFLQAKVICTYISFRSEVDTHNLCIRCLQMGKEVYCPRILGKERMEFYQIHALDDLQDGYWGIKEPPMDEQLIPKQRMEDILLIMPMVGFDRQGNRLGYGGGFYDRYLAKNPIPNRVGLGFDEQFVEEGLPVESFDLRPNWILTPMGLQRKGIYYSNPLGGLVTGDDGLEKERKNNDVGEDG